MQNDDNSRGQENNPELDTNDFESKVPSSDPIDEIYDIDELRGEAKKFRAIANRKAEPKEVKAPEVEVKGEYITKADMAKIAIREAKEQAPSEVQELWDDLFNIPLAGYDPLDAKSIVSNMQDRLAIYKTRNPKGEEKPDTSVLTETKATPTGTAPAPKAEVKEPKNFKLPKKPDEWYK